MTHDFTDARQVFDARGAMNDALNDAAFAGREGNDADTNSAPAPANCS